MSTHDDYIVFRNKMVQAALDQGHKDLAETIINLNTMLGDFFSAGHAEGYQKGHMRGYREGCASMHDKMDLRGLK